MTESIPVPTNKKLHWTGWVLSVLCALVFLGSVFPKLTRQTQVMEMMPKMGFDASIVVPLGILELTCLIIYLIPQTAVLGAVLLTGYLGGTIITHWRLNEPFVINIVLGLVVWGGIYLREPRLWRLLPVRR